MLVTHKVIGDDGGASAEIWSSRPPVSVSAPVRVVEVWREGKLRQVKIHVILDEPADGVEQGP